MLRAITDAFPNVTGIRVRDALDALATVLTRLGTALGSTASVTLLSGLLVLAGAVAAGQRRRIRDAVVLKTLGATRAQIRRAWLVEFGLLGLVAGIVASIVGAAASWGVTRYVMRADWTFLPGTLALTIILCVLLTLAMGYAGTALALRAKAAPLLERVTGAGHPRRPGAPAGRRPAPPLLLRLTAMRLGRVAARAAAVLRWTA
ncbi:FtsX-like permease family protein [Roseomonas sp. CCTCC AB2023176]|uniref:FtsX-like permease family protein n=1 Tax=Roseomonas sp. CCTCC AB2023176 TaxID=3342640 RepID=UPI0035DF32D7